MGINLALIHQRLKVNRRVDNVTGYLSESLRNRGLLKLRRSNLINNNQINHFTVKSLHQLTTIVSSTIMYAMIKFI